MRLLFFGEGFDLILSLILQKRKLLLYASYFQIIGGVLAYRYRNLQDPGKAQASANLYAPQFS